MGTAATKAVGAALFAASVGACAALSGLDSLSSGDCTTAGAVCDDATVDHAGTETGPLAEAGDDVTEDTYVGPTDDGGTEAAVDAAPDVPVEAGCPSGFLACDGGGCADPSAAASCGACGNECGGAAPLCAGGDGGYACVSSCTGATPTQCDGGRCVDTATDLNNCMACGNACTTSLSHAHATCGATGCGYACDTSYTACDGGCVNFSSDPANCGGCGSGHACGSAMVCIGGVCMSEGGDASCSSPTPTACSGTCTNTTTDVNNCGSCGHACTVGGDASPSCVDASCSFTCSSGYTNCSGVCVNEQTDSAHCGGCGTACSGGMTCQSGTCACPTGSHTCGGSCVSNSSLSSCGTGCSACPSPPANGTETCDGTSCGFSCSGGQSPCSGACVNEQTDVNHCGGCSITCASGSTCTNGTCVSPDGGLTCTGCASAGCCGTSCKIPHSNGVGQTYYDCNAAGTYNQTTATEACTAFTGSSSACSLQQTALNPVCPGINAMCGTSSGTCHCWLFTALYLGRPGTVQTPAAGCTVGCSLSTDPPWN